MRLHGMKTALSLFSFWIATTAFAAEDIEFELAPGFQLETVLAEPRVQQPLSINFDERGRMWVVQYRQFPFPAGLKKAGHDEYWRIQYENYPPPAPPNHVPGMDSVTIFEDKDGDGDFETEKDFVTGLNICTSALPGRGGVWVLNPPYLLFYPDADRDDVPDGDPEVRLAGFGLEDLHAVANGLRWGPDGWLYGYQGSTVTADIVRPGLEDEPLHFKGQNLWRYHPTDRRFELFSEGGQNNFGIALDAKGRMFTGGNSGIIGFHHVQGGYYSKNWGKHGNLTNPFAFGYFGPMEDHSSRAKLSQGIVSYDAPQFPDQYKHTLITARALKRKIDVARLEERGSTYAAYELEPPLVSTIDENFRPVDMMQGPDGAVYIADWHDTNITWSVSAEHERIMRETGRIYRITFGEHSSPRPFDMDAATSSELVQYLRHPNKWYRQTALRILYDRRDQSVIPELKASVMDDDSQVALESIWGLHASGGFALPFALQSLEHEDPHVRAWTIRLLGDSGNLNDETTDILIRMAAEEDHPEVRSQLASSARRFNTATALPILSAFFASDRDAEDRHIPLLLWWAVEEHMQVSREHALAWVEDELQAESELFQSVVVSRLGQRLTASRESGDLKNCASLLSVMHSVAQREQFLNGMAKGLGRSHAEVPEELSAVLQDLLNTDPENTNLIVIGVRLGDDIALSRALELTQDSTADSSKRIPVIEVLGEVQHEPAKPILIACFIQSNDTALRRAAVASLARFSDREIGETFVSALPNAGALKNQIAAALVSRSSWARLLMAAVDSGEVAASDVDRDLLQNLAAMDNPEIDQIVQTHWGTVSRSEDEMLARVNGIYAIVKNGPGEYGKGIPLFEERCAKCHELHGIGQAIGPDLSTVDRSNLWDLVTEILDPNRSVLPEFAGSMFSISDGTEKQTLSGFLIKRSDVETTIMDTSGAIFNVPNDHVQAVEPMNISVMPEGLLDGLDDHELRDLFSFLQSETTQ